MVKLTVEHVTSLSHLEQYVFPHIVPNMTPRQREEIENDLERVAQLKSYILCQVYVPTLPTKPKPAEE